MSLADAAARWNRRLRAEKSDPQGDRAALEALALACGRFSPWVGLEEAEPPESLLLDITGVAVLFGGEEALGRAVLQAVASQRLTCYAAIADTVGMAWAAAHFHSAHALQPTLVPTGETAALLAESPVEALRLSPAALDDLADFGLKTVRELLALPRASLTSRLGPELLTRLHQALGETPETIAPVKADREFSVAWEFETATDRAETILAVLERLCASLAASLDEQGCGAGELACTLTCQPTSKVALAVGLFEPAADAGHFVELLRLQLERVTLPGPVAGLRLEALRTSQTALRQQELFADGAQANEREFSLLVNRLAGRLGRNAVVRPVPRAEAQPELAWRAEPLLDGGANKRRRKPSSVRASCGPLERPLLLFQPPVPIETTAVAPDGPPSRFDYRGRTHCIAGCFGPERIETGWWRKRGVRRDYYRIQTEQGARFWLFRSLPSGRWYLHGEFA